MKTEREVSSNDAVGDRERAFGAQEDPVGAEDNCGRVNPGKGLEMMLGNEGIGCELGAQREMCLATPTQLALINTRTFKVALFLNASSNFSTGVTGAHPQRPSTVGAPAL